MTTHFLATTPPQSRSPWATLRLMAGSLLFAGLTACGGGGTAEEDTSASGRSLTGTVTSYDNPQSFSVDGIPVDATGTLTTPQGMTTGSRVEVHGQLVNGTLRATKVEFEDDDDRDDDNRNPNELEGRVTSYSSPTRFSVDGIPVDASAVPTTLAVGMRVEVYGTMTNGILIANKVEIEGSDDDDQDDDRDDDEAEDDDELEDEHDADEHDDRDDD